MEPEVSLLCSQEPTLVPMLIQMNPVHTLLHHFPKIYSNIILPFTPRSSELSIPMCSQQSTAYIVVTVIGTSNHHLCLYKALVVMSEAAVAMVTIKATNIVYEGQKYVK